MTFRASAETITLAGYVTSIEEDGPSFTMRCRSGDIVRVFVGETAYLVLTNIDSVGRDRTEEPDAPSGDADPALVQLRRYVTVNTLLVVRGIHQEDRDHERFEARIVYLLQSQRGGRYVFEETHWWLTQISRLADRWLDDLFDATRDYSVTDYARFYRTNLGITGGPTERDPNLQDARPSRDSSTGCRPPTC